MNGNRAISDAKTTKTPRTKRLNESVLSAPRPTQKSVPKSLRTPKTPKNYSITSHSVPKTTPKSFLSETSSSLDNRIEFSPSSSPRLTRKSASQQSQSCKYDNLFSSPIISPYGMRYVPIRIVEKERMKFRMEVENLQDEIAQLRAQLEFTQYEDLSSSRVEYEMQIKEAKELAKSALAQCEEVLKDTTSEAVIRSKQQTLELEIRKLKDENQQFQQALEKQSITLQSLEKEKEELLHQKELLEQQLSTINDAIINKEHLKYQDELEEENQESVGIIGQPEIDPANQETLNVEETTPPPMNQENTPSHTNGHPNDSLNKNSDNESSNHSNDLNKDLSTLALHDTMHKNEVELNNLQATLDQEREVHRSLEHEFHQFRKQSSETIESLTNEKDRLLKLQTSLEKNLVNLSLECQKLNEEIASINANVLEKDSQLQDLELQLKNLKLEREKLISSNNALHERLNSQNEQASLNTDSNMEIGHRSDLSNPEMFHDNFGDIDDSDKNHESPQKVDSIVETNNEFSVQNSWSSEGPSKAYGEEEIPKNDEMEHEFDHHLPSSIIDSAYYKNNLRLDVSEPECIETPNQTFQSKVVLEHNFDDSSTDLRSECESEQYIQETISPMNLEYSQNLSQKLKLAEDRISEYSKQQSDLEAKIKEAEETIRTFTEKYQHSLTLLKKKDEAYESLIQRTAAWEARLAEATHASKMNLTKFHEQYARKINAADAVINEFRDANNQALDNLKKLGA